MWLNDVLFLDLRRGFGVREIYIEREFSGKQSRNCLCEMVKGHWQYVCCCLLGSFILVLLVILSSSTSLCVFRYFHYQCLCFFHTIPSLSFSSFFSSLCFHPLSKDWLFHKQFVISTLKCSHFLYMLEKSRNS